jgi:hypothetical protein
VHISKTTIHIAQVNMFWSKLLYHQAQRIQETEPDITVPDVLISLHVASRFFLKI